MAFNAVGIKEQGAGRYFKNILVPPGVPKAILREALKDQGFRVIVIRSNRPIAEQVSENPDIFRHQ